MHSGISGVDQICTFLRRDRDADSTALKSDQVLHSTPLYIADPSLTIQPLNRLTNVSIVRLKKGGKRFEVGLPHLKDHIIDSHESRLDRLLQE